MNTPALSVVLPALNEEATIGECIRKIQRVFADLAIEGEIIIADSSDDRTAAIARDLGATVVRPEKRGYGNAYLAGLACARVLSEQKMPLSEFSSLLALLAAGTRTGRRRNHNAVQVVGVREVAHLAVPYLFIGDLVDAAADHPAPVHHRYRDPAARDALEERYPPGGALPLHCGASCRPHPRLPELPRGRRSGFVDAVREAFSPEM